MKKIISLTFFLLFSLTCFAETYYSKILVRDMTSDYGYVIQDQYTKDNGNFFTFLVSTDDYSTKSQHISAVKTAISHYSDMTLVDPWSRSEDGTYIAVYDIENTDHHFVIIVGDNLICIGEFIW